MRSRAVHALPLAVTLCLSLLLALGPGARSARAQSYYSVTALDTLGGSYGTAEGINDSGCVVGGSPTSDGKTHAFLWTGEGAPVAIPTLGGATNIAHAVNSAGDVAGESLISIGATRAFLYHDGAVQDLGTFDGTGSSYAYGINDAGVVVGVATKGGIKRACLWENGQILDLGAPGTESVATAVNDRKQVVGYCKLNSGLVHAFLWQDGVITDLGSLTTNGTSQAKGINEDGIVVGSAGTVNAERPVYWDTAGVIHEIGTLPGDTCGIATSINDHGQIVGASSTSNYSTIGRVFLYNLRAGVLEALDALVPSDPSRTPRGAAFLNNQGRIAGTSYVSYLNRRALLLTPSTTPRLVFATPPGESVAGQSLEPQPAVEAWDATGGVVPDYTGAVTLALKPGTETTGATLSGTTTVPAAGGIASFPGVAIDLPATGYVLTAEGASAFSTQSPAFTVGYPRLYVSTTGDDAGTGESWAAAKKTISAALAAPLRVHQSEVWVAAGAYTEAVIVQPGTRLFGGFAGTESRRDERDVRSNETAIVAPSTGSDVLSVRAGATRSTEIDGVTIRGGMNGINLNWASPSIRNNLIDGNGRGIETVGVTSPLIEGNTVSHSINGGIRLGSGNPIVRGNVIRNNRFGNMEGGGIRLEGGAAEVSGNLFAHNIAYGGAGLAIVIGSPLIHDNVFRENVGLDGDGNSVAGDGGAIICRKATARIVNNTFLANGAHDGGQIALIEGAPVIANNLFALGSSGIHNDKGTPVLSHNAFWSNGSYTTEGITDGIGTNGNVEADPKLASLYARDVHLQPDSPLVDAGDSAYVVEGETDMDGEGRIQGAAVDIGADESDGTAWNVARGRVCVRPDGDDANDGRSWATAKRTIPAAMAEVAESGDEVWVAEGTYPGSITLGSFVSLYGGFAGTEETRDGRDVRGHPTVLQGTGAGADVVAVSPGSQMVAIDGLTVQNGHAGIRVKPLATAVVTNNVARNNAWYGIFAGESSVISGNHCVFNGHQDGGGGIAAGGSATVTGNIVEYNAYRGNAAGAAGGISVGGEVDVTGNVVRDNIGAGIGTTNNGQGALIRNNVVTGNTGDGLSIYYGYFNSRPILNNIVADNGGIGVNLYRTGTILVANNTVVGNRKNHLVNAAGGVFLTSDSKPTMVNNIIAFNNGGIDGAYFGTSPESFRNNCIYQNSGFDFSGFPDPTGTYGNVGTNPGLADIANGNFHIQPDSPCVDAGDATGLPDGLTDIDGTARVQGTGIDIGADESDGTVWTPTTHRVYVSPNGSDAATGSSWPEAKRTVQAGIDTVRDAGGGEVWVAAGTYAESVHLGSYTRVYGGFRGDEAELSQRSATANPTVIDAQGRANVVSTRGRGTGTVLDGFTLQNGVGTPVGLGSEASSLGGGVQLTESQMTLSNNVITGNSARQGGGIWSIYGEPVIRGNVISDNTASEYGGGLYCLDNGTVVDNVITGNTAPKGGGVVGWTEDAPYNPVTLTVARNVIRDNSGTDGAGLFLQGYNVPVRDNLIVNNTATGRGGGIISNAIAQAVNNTIAYNTAPQGGAVYVAPPGGPWPYPQPLFSNSILAFNSSGIFVETNVHAVFRFNDAFGNGTANYTGISDPTGASGNIGADPLFVDAAGGDYRLAAGSPCIDAGSDAEARAGETDLLGNARILGAHVDMGAYEMPFMPSVQDAAHALRIAGGLQSATDGDVRILSRASEDESDTTITVEDALLLLKQSLSR